MIGIDPSLKMLDQARRKLTSDNVVYCQGRLRRFRAATAVPILCSCRWLPGTDEKRFLSRSWQFNKTSHHRRLAH
jgi:hypothetical protein